MTLTGVTIPIPEPYDDKAPNRQRENLCFVLLQIIQQMKTDGVELFPGGVTGGSIDAGLLAEIRDNIGDLKFNDEKVIYSDRDRKIEIDMIGRTVMA